MNIGLRVFPKTPAANHAAIEQFRRIPSSCIADAMGRFASIGGEMKAYHPMGLKMAGTAFTVRVSPADNLMLHKALEMAGPGDVVIVEAGGELTNAITGEMMCTYAKKRGVEGMVIDGAIRDRAGIWSLNFPVYAKGVQPRGPYKDGPGEVNVPIVCHGVVVHPGDIVVGDDDGLVVVPANDAEVVLRKAQEKAELEEAMMKAILAGTLDQTWVDRLLNEKGCTLSTRPYGSE